MPLSFLGGSNSSIRVRNTTEKTLDSFPRGIENYIEYPYFSRYRISWKFQYQH